MNDFDKAVVKAATMLNLIDSEVSFDVLSQKHHELYEGCTCFTFIDYVVYRLSLVNSDHFLSWNHFADMAWEEGASNIQPKNWRMLQASIHEALDQIQEDRIIDNNPELPRGNFWAS
ncbi:MAG: hypothetical protein GY829_03390 [Gammaproteobacteria bacterium]|nr:hypothetical protein [Gammaproteobacteria bacterium]